MSANMTTDTRSLPLAALKFSTTPAQKVRRAQFDKTALQEMADTIKAAGRPEQPIIVRPFRDEHVKGEAYEVADGERRCIASKMAGLIEVPCEIRELSDQQVEEIQIVTGLQKEGLHELAEAEGYESLQKRGHSIEEIAAKTGKSKATIYGRMKLLALCAKAREAFYAGKISASIALLIARIPIEELQEKALEKILKPWEYSDEPMNYRDAARHVQDEYMLRLSEAPFPRDDATLVPTAGTCGACPKRTGNQPELFGDVKGADVCTDPACFKLKRAAWNKLQVAKAKETGQPVITGAAAKKIVSPWGSDLREGYVRPQDKCQDDPKQRTYAQLLGKAGTSAPAALLQNPTSGKFSKVYKKEDIAEHLKKQGIKLSKDPAENKVGNERRWAEEQAKREREEKFRSALWAAIFKAAPTKLGRSELEAVAGALFQTGYGPDEELYQALGWKTGKGSFESNITKLSDVELNQLLFALVLWPEASDGYGEPKKLLAAAKRLKVDIEQVRKGLIEEKAKEVPPAKASKKKAARK